MIGALGAEKERQVIDLEAVAPGSGRSICRFGLPSTPREGRTGRIGGTYGAYLNRGT